MQLGIGVNLFKRQKKEGVPIRDGLVAEYLFDEGRGQVLCDYIGNGNHGQLGSTPYADTNDPLWTPQGLQFDGVDDRVIVQDNENFDFRSMTIIFTPYNLSNRSFFIRRGAPYFWGIYRNAEWSEGQLAFLIYFWRKDASRGAHLVHLFPKDIATLNVTAVVEDSGRLNVYKNGILFDSRLDDDFDCWCYYPGDLLIGDMAQGNIHLVHIYNRSLSGEEVLQNHEWAKTVLAERGVILA